MSLAYVNDKSEFDLLTLKYKNTKITIIGKSRLVFAIFLSFKGAVLCWCLRFTLTLKFKVKYWLKFWNMC